MLGYQHASAQQTHCRGPAEPGWGAGRGTPVGVGGEEGDPWLCGAGQLGAGVSLHSLWWSTQWGWEAGRVFHTNSHTLRG